jgi:asparagine synthetase B (glutamine-hydrolysing)
VAASCGVDVRWPFADVDLWEFALSLPAQVKFRDLETKGLLRKVMRGRIPDEIIDRRDKTVFDEYSISRAEYSVLGRLLSNPSVRVQGIDYKKLGDRIERAEMTLPELQWARDLARIHAFIEVCS